MKTVIPIRRSLAMVLGIASVLAVWDAASIAGTTAGAAEGPGEIVLTATADTWAGFPHRPIT